MEEIFQQQKERETPFHRHLLQPIRAPVVPEIVYQRPLSHCHIYPEQIVNLWEKEMIVVLSHCIGMISLVQ